MHVDGFRFDLASILSRDSTGHPLPNPPVLWDIESDPALAGTKLIAEAWDAAGLYQVGSFIGDAWKEWNGRFRDDVRDFFRGEPGSVGRVADRLLGSHEVYGHKEREAEQSINFVTCHDGFTLNDLVSYNQKHNEANGEENRDGANDNKSWNCGVEGPTDDPAIEELRNRQVKNFLTVTLMSLGMPMILMGDEVRRTQGGNNNSYCHDNEANWFDWSLVEKHADVHRFVKLLLARRLLRDVEHEEQRMSLTEMIAAGEQGLARREAEPAGLGRRFAQHRVRRRAARRKGSQFHLILNAYWEPLEFELPARDGRGPWRRWIDTSLPVAGGHRRVEGGPAGARRELPGRAAVGGHAVLGERVDRFSKQRGVPMFLDYLSLVILLAGLTLTFYAVHLHSRPAVQDRQEAAPPASGSDPRGVLAQPVHAARHLAVHLHLGGHAREDRGRRRQGQGGAVRRGRGGSRQSTLASVSVGWKSGSRWPASSTPTATNPHTPKGDTHGRTHRRHLRGAVLAACSRSSSSSRSPRTRSSPPFWAAA